MSRGTYQEAWRAQEPLHAQQLEEASPPRVRIILVVNETGEEHQSLAGMLRDAGFDVVFATDQRSLESALSKHRVTQIAVTQFISPLPQAHQIMDTLRDEQIPIVMIADRRDGNMARFLARDGEILFKPCSSQQLLEAIRRHLPAQGG